MSSYHACGGARYEVGIVPGLLTGKGVAMFTDLQALVGLILLQLK